MHDWVYNITLHYLFMSIFILLINKIKASY